MTEDLDKKISDLQKGQNELNIQVQLLKNNIEHIGKFFDKLEESLEKSNQILSKLTEMVSVHDNEINRIRDDLSNNQIHPNSSSSLSYRLRKVEFWQWAIIGGTFAVGIMIGNIDLFSSIFGS